MTRFIDLASLEDIPRQGARLIRTAAGCVAVFRTADDSVFALDDRCPHKGGPLSEGIVHGHQVTCPLHNWVFDLNTGTAQGTDEGAVRTWPVTVSNGRVLISADLLSRHQAA
ncbi:nitrite reductase small subunit NirD [Paracoccus sediminilitoris]|uniref:nitrite reductase small subunit NirD n=1 Tax=Paracoccus sediminilitoris TaxID=2202419 RepID=UPI000DB912C8|nr:nitrite reductase small subunit NirD [Paracoccus sediminilitoris]